VISAGGPVAPAPKPADVALVAALPMEVGPLLRRFRDVRKYSNGRVRIVEGLLAGRLVALVVAGPGRPAARRATALLLAGHRPKWVVSAGFGGALDPALARNDVLFATEVIDPDGFCLAIDGTPPTDETPGRRIRSGRLLTVDAIVRTTVEKADLRERYRADLVDMETSAVAAVCAERGARLLAIRVVSDEAGIDLPPEILGILGATGSYRLGAALGAIWHRPSSLVDLLTLREHGLQAADRLAEVVEGAIAQLS
jgi:adenosylhomocysteine nucleosidase